MDHSASAHPSPASSGSFASNTAHNAYLDPSLSALHDFLASTSTGFPGSPQGADGMDGTGGNAGAGQAGQAANLTDLLAEFTTNAMSPDASSSRGGTDANAGMQGLMGFGNGMGDGSSSMGTGMEGLTGAKSAQEILLEHLKQGYPNAPVASPASQHSGSHQSSPQGQAPPMMPQNGLDANDQIAPELQQQLQQLFAQTGVLASQTPTPTGPPSYSYQPQQPPPHSHSHHASPHSHYIPAQSPASFSHPSSSQHASPMPAYPSSGQPSPYPPPSITGSPYAHQPQQQPQYSAPPPVSSATPVQPVFALPQAQLAALLQAQQNAIPIQAQMAALQLILNAQLQAGAQAQAQAQQQAHHAAVQQHQQAHTQQQQHAQQQHQQHQQLQPLQMPPQNGGSTAGNSVDGSYRDNEFIFSPAMSPVMTPHSAFTAASSLPPSVGPLPMVSPADLFPPLTSPALGPQLYGSDMAARSGVHHAHRNSLQGLVDGVGALSTHLPPGSPSGYFSPRLGPTDAGTSTGAGAGRRGASSSSKKTRPSPLIKPTPDSAFDRRRRKTQPGPTTNGDKRASMGGNKSATSSPFLGPQQSGRNGGGMSSAPSSIKGGSPNDASNVYQTNTSANSSTNGSAASVDTPSPVDLPASQHQLHHVHPPQPMYAVGHDGQPVPAPAVPSHVFAGQPPTPQQQSAQQYHQQQQYQQQQQQPYQLEPMGPPPPPSSYNPVTPASFMNFASDFNVDSISSLSPSLNAVINPSGQHYEPSSSALSSLQNSPALLPQPESAVPIPEEDFMPPPLPSSSGKAPKTRKTPSAKPSPALKPVDAKGKGKGKSNSPTAADGSGSSGSSTANGKKGAKKVGPSPRIGPSPKIKPLLGSGAAPDAQTRLAAKSNYENILDGRGPDLLGLPPSMQSELQANATPAGAAAETRRSSHKVAEQKRRDSLKLCFDELRRILPPILPYTDEADRRPGDGNVGGQRHGEIDPENPNKGVSKVALLRRSNEYLDILRDRIDRRDTAISALRSHITQMRAQLGIEELGEDEEEVPGLDLDLDNIDKEEKQAGNLAFYEDLDFDQKVPSLLARKTSTSRRSTATNGAEPRPPTRATGTRRSARTAKLEEAMDIERQEESE
ncbi:transcription regulator [Rhodotorula toruloides]|uniref:Transcription regulator n=1 Tax=Rhodotorula toruloides TaxID=5286 RepID=A0A511KAG0_RHOTO|nr:transcription regulator [Rhodotorula toruloides]